MAEVGCGGRGKGVRVTAIPQAMRDQDWLVREQGGIWIGFETIQKIPDRIAEIS